MAIGSVTSMTSVTVAVAGPENLDALVESVTALFREDGGAHDPAMDVTWPVREGRAYYGGLIGDDTCLLAVARDGDQVVGHLVGKVLEPDSIRRERFALLESIRVDPARRGTGIGGMLIDHFLAWGRTHAARRASVTAFAANHRALRLYSDKGFAPMSITCRTTL
jgi:GNAT superfamily N-acetyltransferase